MPHDVNYGYETWKHAIAIAVNGDFFSNVAEMKALVDAIEHGLIEIEILGAPSIILDAVRCKETDAELRGLYNINAACSVDLKGAAESE